MDVLQCEDADADLSQHVPFLGDAVGLARVVDEPGQVAFVGRVDDFSLGGLHEIGAGGLAELFDPRLAEFRVGGEDLPDVLHDERSSRDRLSSAKPPPLPARRHRIHIGILMLLKLAIGAEFTAIAGVIVAFSRDHAVEAPFSAVVGDVGVLNGVLIGLRAAEARLHFIIFGDLTLAIQVNVLLDGREVFETLPEVVQSDLIVLQHADHLSLTILTSFFLVDLRL